jgi:hypothetical protein
MQDQKRLSQDDIYSALLLSYQLDGFVHQTDLYPSLTIVMGMKEFVDNLNSSLDIEQDCKTMFSIDMTVTPLLCKNFIHKKGPTTPISFILHEKRTKNFMNVIFLSYSKNAQIGKRQTLCLLPIAGHGEKEHSDNKETKEIQIDTQKDFANKVISAGWGEIEPQKEHICGL